MAEHEDGLGASADPLDALGGGVEVDVGGRGGGAEHPHVREMDPERVTGPQRTASRFDQADVMRRVPRRVQDLEGPVTKGDRVPVRDGPQPVGRYRVHRTEQPPEPLLPVDPPRARQQLAGVLEVWRAPFVDPHRGLREAGGKRPDASGVVQVDVRDHDVRQVPFPDPQRAEPQRDGVDGGGGTGLDQDGLAGSDQVGGGDHGPPRHPCVDAQDPWGRLERGLHECAV